MPLNKTMENQTNKLIPNLRFPEFANEGGWESEMLNNENIAKFINEKVTLQEFQKGTYVSTENLLPDFGGVVLSTKLPSSGSFTKFKEGDILVSNIRPYLRKVWFSNVKGAASNDVIVIRSGKKVDKVFLSFHLKNDNFIDYIMKGAEGVKMPRGDKDSIKEYNISFPKSAEQQKIAACLSSLDELIAAHSQKLDALKDHKKGLMQNLFPQEGETVPKLRFPEFMKNEEWEEKKLGKLIDIKGRIGYRGYTLNDIVSKGEGAISMSPSNIDEYGVLNFSKSTYITWDKYAESPEIMLQNNFTVLVKTGSTFGKVAFMKNLIEKTTINPQLVVLKPTKINSFFLYLIVSNSSVQRKINETVVGGAIPTLSQDSISKFEVLIPRFKEQQKISSCLSSLDALITAQSEKIEQLKLHKKGLMQGLFPKIND